LHANSILNQTFIASRDGDWFALEKVQGPRKFRMVQFHRPSISLLAQPVSDTDRMNGISERCVLTLMSEQYRYWSVEWTEWKPGSSKGGGEFINSIVGGAFGYWTLSMERKKGQWIVRNKIPIHDFKEDKTLLKSFLKEAGMALVE